MRHTGKYWYVTMGATVLSVASTTRIAFWDNHTSNFELWFDIVPIGLGIGAIVTSTLIVRDLVILLSISDLLTKGIIACVSREDMAVATGSTSLIAN
jgi:hypothetical protein